MTNQEFLKLLKEKKVADAYQYFEACEYKLYLAGISVNALDKIINDYKVEGSNAASQMFEDAVQRGKNDVRLLQDSQIDFCGIEIPVSTAMTKLTMEALSLLHNFFDTYAQWINLVLFGEQALPTKSVSINRVIQKLQQYPEYTGQFITDLSNVTDKSNPTDYHYISDFNNTVKHRTQIHVHNSINMFTAEGSVAVPAFEKDDTYHAKKEVIDVIHSGLDFCKKLLVDSRQYIETYYNSADCKYVDHRYYNPKEFLAFDSEEDCKQMKNVKDHYAFIEIDPAKLDSEYQIMIARDTTSQKDGRISLYNSPYSILMLREIGTYKIFGILTPEDNSDYSVGDHHLLTYRKYIPKTVNYEVEMAKAINGKDFEYHPLLVDNEILIFNPKT